MIAPGTAFEDIPEDWICPVKSGMTWWNATLVCNIFILHYLCPYERDLL